MTSATAKAHPNIAFIKYWGNRDNELHIPSNGSVSMNLGELYTKTRLTFNSSFNKDQLKINESDSIDTALDRVSTFLTHFRQITGETRFAMVESQNNFPMGTGIASSASAFAALSLAAIKATGVEFQESELSRLARHGSGSACRSA